MQVRGHFSRERVRFTDRQYEEVDVNDRVQQVSKEMPGRLRRARLAARVTTVDAARTLGVRRPAISEMESGRRRCRSEELEFLAERYGVSVKWILGIRADNARDERVDLAADLLADLSSEALEHLLAAIDVVKKRRRRLESRRRFDEDMGWL